MAIKGKKKRKSRQPSRRPAAAPRPVVTTGRQIPWYRTSRGRAIAAVVAVVLLIVGGVVFKNRSDDQEALAKDQEKIEGFTGDTEALLQSISPSATEMVAAKPESKDLAKDAKRWIGVFEDARDGLTDSLTRSPLIVDVSNRLIYQSVLQYIAAAETYKLVPEASGDLRDDLAERAKAQVTAADGTWEGAVAALDEQREEADLDPSGLRVPSAATAPTGPGDGTLIPSGG